MSERERERQRETGRERGGNGQVMMTAVSLIISDSATPFTPSPRTAGLMSTLVHITLDVKGTHRRVTAGIVDRKGSAPLRNEGN